LSVWLHWLGWRWVPWAILCRSCHHKSRSHGCYRPILQRKKVVCHIHSNEQNFEMKKESKNEMLWFCGRRISSILDFSPPNVPILFVLSFKVCSFPATKKVIIVSKYCEWKWKGRFFSGKHILNASGIYRECGREKNTGAQWWAMNEISIDI